MREVLTAAAHTAGYILLTGAAVWLALRFLPAAP